MAALYEPAGPEDFRSQRSRFDRQETLMYGPRRQNRHQHELGQPYPQPPSAGTTKSEENELFSQAFSVSEIDSSALPAGWLVDEAGYFQLSHRPSDFWEVRSGCLIRHHVHPRFNLFHYEKEKDAPIDKSLLDPIRVTLVRLANGN